MTENGKTLNSCSFDFGKLYASRLKLPDFYKLRGEIGVIHIHEARSELGYSLFLEPAQNFVFIAFSFNYVTLPLLYPSLDDGKPTLYNFS